MAFINGKMDVSMKDNIERINKHGYGIYYWADGRKYEGYWAHGKQHGLGRYLIPQDGKEKYGLWEDGKRTEWFDDEMAERIKAHTQDYRVYFRKEDSANH